MLPYSLGCACVFGFHMASHQARHRRAQGSAGTGKQHKVECQRRAVLPSLPTASSAHSCRKAANRALSPGGGTARNFEHVRRHDISIECACRFRPAFAQGEVQACRTAGHEVSRQCPGTSRVCRGPWLVYHQQPPTPAACPHPLKVSCRWALTELKRMTVP